MTTTSGVAALIAAMLVAAGACGSGGTTAPAGSGTPTSAPISAKDASAAAPAPMTARPTPGLTARAGRPEPWSLCSAATGLADPAGVHGLFFAGPNQTDNASLEASILQYLPAEPTICGANLIIPWSSIDRGPGANPRYDWSYLDQAAALWRRLARS